jgi:hypothetical protein
MKNSIKESITLTLTDEELMELLRMILGEDEKETLSLLQKHFKDKARAVLEGEGHCKPSFEVLGLL